MYQFNGLRIAVAPTVEPILVADVKTQARIDHDDEDTLITSYLIPQSREIAEAYTGRAFVAQTWDMWLDLFPPCIFLPMPPTISVTWIKYTDTAGDEQTLDAADYTVDTSSEPARIVPVYAGSWPTVRAVPNAVTVRFVAGYDSGNSPQDATAVPVSIKHAIMMEAATLYENRENFVLPERGMASAIQTLPTAARSLLARYRVSFF